MVQARRTFIADLAARHMQAAASHLSRANVPQHRQGTAQSAPGADQPRSGLPAAQELTQEIGPFEPENVVAALAAQDAKPEAKVGIYTLHIPAKTLLVRE